MANAGPALRGAVLECVNKEGVSPDVQMAAIRVFRLTSVPEEVDSFEFNVRCRA